MKKKKISTNLRVIVKSCAPKIVQFIIFAILNPLAHKKAIISSKKIPQKYFKQQFNSCFVHTKAVFKPTVVLDQSFRLVCGSEDGNGTETTSTTAEPVSHPLMLKKSITVFTCG